MPAHFSISRTSKNPIVFAGLGCAKNAGSGPGVEFRSRLLPQPQQCPGLAGAAAWGAAAGSGRRCIPSLHCELLQRRDECQALRGAKALNRLFFFFSSLGFFFFSTFPRLSCLPSESWVSNAVSVLQLCPENHLRSVRKAAPTCASLWLLRLV